MNKLNKKILECEFEYQKCFSYSEENEDTIRFRDEQLKDMYYHNYTYIKDEVNENKIVSIIEDEILLRLTENSDYCNILLDGKLDISELDNFKYIPQISLKGYYKFDISKFSNLKNIDCTIKQVKNSDMIEDILYCDLQHDEGTLGRDFCARRCYRRGKEYISDNKINSYMCYYAGDKIGNCDLFIHNGVAKLEDFAVIPKHQHRGYGTSILKKLIDIAIKESCNYIYLVTDEDDTAKEMYKKLGFEKVGERIDLFFKI